MKTNLRKWTEDEDRQVVAAEENDTVLAEKLNRSEKAISVRRSNLKNKGRTSKPKHDEAGEKELAETKSVLDFTDSDKNPFETIKEMMRLLRPYSLEDRQAMVTFAQDVLSDSL